MNRSPRIAALGIFGAALAFPVLAHPRSGKTMEFDAAGKCAAGR
jgi:hypothetical protein